MYEIAVERMIQLSPDKMWFRLIVRDGTDRTIFEISLPRSAAEADTHERPEPEEIAEQAMRVLLERSAPEDIPTRFDLAPVLEGGRARGGAPRSKLSPAW